MKMTCEAIGETSEEMDDLREIENEQERAKVLKQQIQKDWKKAQKVKEAKERVLLWKKEVKVQQFAFQLLTQDPRLERNQSKVPKGTLLMEF